jgi:predicted transcriptional regulator
MNANGCSSASTATAVTVATLPTATIVAGGVTSFCAGGNVTLNANGGTGLSYQWRNNGTAIAGATTSSYIASTSGAYTVAVTNSNGCQNISAATNVSANAAPSAVVTTVSPTTFCAGGNVVLSAPAAAGSSYQWLKNGSNIATGANYIANTSGSYTVNVTDANGCVATSTSTSVTVNALPTATISATGNTTLCQGDNVTLNVSGGTSYAWSTGSTATSITVNTAGAYTVVVTDANGCTAATTQQVSVNALPVATSAATTATTFCAGGSVVLNANTGTGLTYQWLNNGTAVAGATAATYAANMGGSYTVVVTAANGCRNTSNATAVTVNAAPTPALTTSRSPNLCPGDNVTLTIAGGTSYLWSTGATTTTVVASTAGTYTVTVTNAAGCTATASQAVVVNALPLSTITAGGLTSFCPGDNVALSAPVGNNYTYQWRNNGTAIAGATNRVYSANAVGSYTVLVTESSTGCSSASAAPIAVTVFAKPTVSFTRTVQAGTTSVVDFANTSSAGTVLWSFGDALNSTSTQQNPTFWYKANGTYTIKLKVTNSNGCVDSLVQTVTVTIRTDLSELAETLKAVAYPNPFSDRLVIEVQNPQVAFSNNDRLVVTNGLGQIVHTAAFNQKMIEISTTEWAAGIYNLTIYSNGKVIPMKKVVKMDQ